MGFGGWKPVVARWRSQPPAIFHFASGEGVARAKRHRNAAWIARDSVSSVCSYSTTRAGHRPHGRKRRKQRWPHLNHLMRRRGGRGGIGEERKPPQTSP